MTRGREALVQLPGFLCDQVVWQDQIDLLWDVADCTCAAYGMADSLPAMADPILRTAPPQFSVAGHSLGGRIAWEIFRRAPERVCRLAVFDTGTAKRSESAAGVEEERGRRRLLAVARSDGMRAMAFRMDPGKGRAAAAHRHSTSALIVSMFEFERKTPDVL